MLALIIFSAQTAMVANVPVARNVGELETEHLSAVRN